MDRYLILSYRKVHWPVTGRELTLFFQRGRFTKTQWQEYEMTHAQGYLFTEALFGITKDWK